ncbi:MAG: hypothetical protein K2O08_01430 [Clostridia bacterium]|nr:hypothetical protein [Clostridia bacterium]
MNYWGAGISANNDFADCKEIFFDNFYHEKISIKEIENKILDIYRSPLQDAGGLHNAYFAIAECEWKCGCLSEEIFSAVEEIISNGKDIEYWKSLKPKAKVIRRRENCLQKFLDKIKSENAKPINRSFRKRFDFPLKTGDVFAHFSKANGCYGCGVVLEAIKDDSIDWAGEYNFRALVAISELTPKFLPTVEEMLSENTLDVFWNGDNVYTLPKKGFIVIDNIADKIDKDYSLYFGSFYDKGRIRQVGSIRPDFDILISKDPNSRLKDKFSVINKPMTYFFDKNNLKKTEELLK